jgi:hypothetical protein
MDTTQPFQFLDLPAELRLMIYECLEGGVRHTRVDLPANKNCLEPMIILLTRTFPVALLRVSHEINHEARPTVVRLAEEWITSHPARVMSSYYVAREITNYLLEAVLDPNFRTVDSQDIDRLSDVAQGKSTILNSAGPKFLNEDFLYDTDCRR